MIRDSVPRKKRTQEIKRYCQMISSQYIGPTSCLGIEILLHPLYSFLINTSPQSVEAGQDNALKTIQVRVKIDKVYSALFTIPVCKTRS